MAKKQTQKSSKPKTKRSAYKCYFCSGNTTLEDAIKVDQKLDKMDPEDHEFLLDELPRLKNPKKKPFVHRCKYGYDVVNLCRKCFLKAKRLIEE